MSTRKTNSKSKTARPKIEPQKPHLKSTIYTDADYKIETDWIPRAVAWQLN